MADPYTQKNNNINAQTDAMLDNKNQENLSFRQKLSNLTKIDPDITFRQKLSNLTKRSPDFDEDEATRSIASLTPIVGDAMAAKEVYDELQKDNPNYLLVGALGGAAIIGLIPGIGDAAAAAIRTGAKKALDVGKRIEVDPDAVGALGGNIRLAPRKRTSLTLDDFGYEEDNPVTKGFPRAKDWLSGKIKQAGKSEKLLDGATTAFLGTTRDKPLFLDIDFISSLKGASDEVRKKGDLKYDRLKKSVDEEGFNPERSEILIEVNHKGEAYIVEGNTRVTLAKELGVPNIKAEIRYKNGAELVDGPFSPQNILEKSSTGSYPEALAPKKISPSVYKDDLPPRPEEKSGEKYEDFLKRISLDESLPVSFKTSRGSTYKHFNDGSTFRNRADDQQKDVFVPQPIAPKTIFMSNNDTNKVGPLFTSRDPGLYQFTPIEGQEGTAQLVFTKNYGNPDHPNFKKAGDAVPNTEVSFTMEPKVGDHPIEIYESTNNNGALGGPRVSIHFGSEITEVFDDKKTKFAKGGILMNKQMELVLQGGGMADDGMTKDPVSGNEVPPGSLAKEVRDDIPAQLSEGEYVVPADVARYYGINFFENLRNQAKQGLNVMEQTGRIGGEPVPPSKPIMQAASGGMAQDLSNEELQAIKEVMGFRENFNTGTANAQKTTDQTFHSAAQTALDAQPTFKDTWSLGSTIFKPTAGAMTSWKVTLYSPEGKGVELTLPQEQPKYDELISKGYTTVKPIETVKPKPKEKEPKDPTDPFAGIDPNRWMNSFDYKNATVDTIFNNAQNLLKEKTGLGKVVSNIFGGGFLGLVNKMSNVAKARAQVILLEASGHAEKANLLKTSINGYIKENGLTIIDKNFNFAIDGKQFYEGIKKQNPNLVTRLSSSSTPTPPVEKGGGGGNGGSSDNDFSADPIEKVDANITSTSGLDKGITQTGKASEGNIGGTQNLLEVEKPTDSSATVDPGLVEKEIVDIGGANKGGLMMSKPKKKRSPRRKTGLAGKK